VVASQGEANLFGKNFQVANAVSWICTRQRICTTNKHYYPTLTLYF